MAVEKSRKARDFSNRDAFNPNILLKTALIRVSEIFHRFDGASHEHRFA